jgi:hypothetical protein
VNPLLRVEQPTLYIAIGGVGMQVLRKLRELTTGHAHAGCPNDAVKTIALDTDRDELRAACSKEWAFPLSSDDTLHLPLRLPKSYEDSREILGFVSRRWLYNIPRSLETRGYRPLGRVALADHAKRVFALIDTKLQQLAAVVGSTVNAGEVRDATIRVVLLAGTGGGTGGGMAIDIANSVRYFAAKQNLQVQVQGLLVCTCLSSSNSSPLAAANTYSLLIELSNATAFGNVGAGGQSTTHQPFESPNAPFDCVYCVPTGNASADGRATFTIDSVAEYLAFESSPEFRAAIRSCRISPTPRETSRARSLTLKKFGWASLGAVRQRFIDKLAVELSSAVRRLWLTSDESADWARLVHEEQRTAVSPRLAIQNGSEHASNAAMQPVKDATPLALRARFNEHMSLQFTSEVLRQISRQLEARDDRGRPLLRSHEAKLIADTAMSVADRLKVSMNSEFEDGGKFNKSPQLRSLIVEGSRRVLSRALETFDFKQPKRFLPADAIDELTRCECLALLEESFTQPDLSNDLSALIDLDVALSQMVDQVTNDLLQCGCDRRTLVVTPRAAADRVAIEKLRALRPFAASVIADVDDVFVISEDAGVSPRSFAAGLGRVFPGVADAARRLHTRTDIEWQNFT